MPARGVQLYDAKTGRPLDFATPDEAHAALDAGVAGVSRKAPVPVVDPDGRVGTVAPQDLAQMRAAGGRLATAEDQRKAELEAKYGRPGTLADQALGFVAREIGSTRGITAGLSDVAAVELSKAFLGAEKGDKVRQFLSDMKEHQGFSSTVGEVGGAVGAALIGNEAGAAQGAGRLARFLPSALIDSAGAATEGMIARSLGAGEGALARAGSSAFRLGSRAAVEGALYNVGSAVSEAELGDHELNAEKLFAAAQSGALTGFVGGGVLGGAGSLAASGAKGIARAVAPRLSAEAEIQAVRMFEPDRRLEKMIKRLPGEEHGLGRFGLDEGIPQIGQKATSESIVNRVEAVRASAIADLENFYMKVDASAFKPPSHARIASRVNEDVIVPAWATRHSNPAPVSVAQNVLRDLADAPPATFSEWRAFRGKLDDMIAWNVPPPGAKANPTQDALRSIRTIVNDEIAGAADAASPGLRKELEALNKRFRYANTYQDLVDHALAREGSTLSLGLRDTGAGLATIAGAVASGNPLWALASPAASYAYKAARERGNATAAVIMDRVAAFGAIRKAQAEVDGKIASAVEAYLAPRGPRPRLGQLASAGESPSAEYDRRVKALDDVRADPAAAVTRAHERVAPVAAHVPLTAEAHAAVASRAIPFLLNKEPRGRAPSVSTMPQFDKPRITDTERDKFLEYARAVEDPTRVLRDMEKGTVSREQVEALQVVYPKLYEQVVATVREKLVQAKEPPPYQKLQQLSILLGAPLTETQTPEFTAAMQRSAANSNAPKQQAPSGPAPLAKGPVKIDPSLYTTSPELTK